MKELTKKELEKIEIPDNLHERCAMGMKKAKQEEKKMKNGSKKIGKMAAAAAALAFCVFVGSNLAIADPVKGIFKDVTRWDGAVVGTAYEQATDEVRISVREVTLKEEKVQILVEMEFYNKENAPFIFLEELELGEFLILDEGGKELKLEGAVWTENAKIKDGKAEVILLVDAAKMQMDKSYTLVIESFYGLAKADAPIEIKGIWKMELK